jgi:hypothetical protein
VSDHEFEFLKVLENLNGVDFWDPLNRKNESIRVMVEPEYQESFEKALNVVGMKYEVIIDDVEKVFIEENKQQKLHKIEGRSSIDFLHFWTLDEINLYLDELAAEYPSLVQVESIGKSYEGREIRAVKISLNGGVDDTRPVVLADGTLHAREWIGTMVSIHLIHELVEHSYLYTDILSKVDIIIVPVLNVDGYVYSHDFERLWRKTRSPNIGSTCLGTDPNRNFDYQWNTPGGSSTSPCSLSYRGSAPHSESEVAALAALMKKYENLKLYLAIHSYGNWVLYPYGYALGVPVSNANEHHQLGVQFANTVRAINGTSYTVGNSADLLYIASGASDDYAAAVGKAHLAYTLELPGGGSNGFDIQAYRIPAVVAETFPGIVFLINYIVETFA